MSTQPNLLGYVSDASDVQNRRSSRISTPIKRSGMIQPSPDSRRSIVRPPLSEQRTSASEISLRKRKRLFVASDSDSQISSTHKINKEKTRKKKTGSQAISSNSEAPTSEVVDIAQDSDEENSKIKHKRQRRDPFDDPRAFFSVPFRRKDDPESKPAQTHTCLWCSKEVRASGSSLSNLLTHRDGSRQTGRNSYGCPKRQEAITAGAKLPPTVHEEETLKISGTCGTITNYFAPTAKFDNGVFNQIVTLWLLRQAIPWNRVEDPYLKAAFHYCEAGANLFKRKWAANSAREVYLDLQDAMLKRLKDANSKFIEESEDEAVGLNMNEGDDESDDDNDSDDLNDDEDDMIEEQSDTEAEQSNQSGNSQISTKSVTNRNSQNQTKSATNRNSSNELNELTKAASIFLDFLWCSSCTDSLNKQLDFVVEKITGSCVWRQEFDRQAKVFDEREGGKPLKGLIAGYGIRWNIKYQSRKRAYKAREVLDSMLHDEYIKYQDQIVRSSRQENRKKLGHFKEIQFTAKDWMMIDELNQELKPFNRLTKIMEGDGPTGAFVLPNYYQIIADLKRKEEACDRGHAFHPMFVKMIDKLQVYQDEALNCETLGMATLLHPSFRLRLFSHCWPEKAIPAQQLLERHFSSQDKIMKNQKSNGKEKSTQTTQPINKENIFELFNAPPALDKNEELEAYIKNIDHTPGPSAKDPKSVLVWWKFNVALLPTTSATSHPTSSSDIVSLFISALR
ncbi:hypothetical protein KEM48_007716 [Puccinia striiformis f. sp. tritici PST-130]|nr:hypothetical protein KEM48_007716 [Puccinia striiformis f. sp. tritici PST-130]